MASGSLAHADLFARHLDLAPLRRRRRGVVRCPFHDDRRPSLSVDLDAAVFNCFGCGERGGWKRFAELVGESSPPLEYRSHRHATPLARARRAILQTARRQPWAEPESRLLYALADRVRQARRAVIDLRTLADRTEDEAQRWDVLATAARIETLTNWLEMELDEVAMLGCLTTG